MELAWSVEEQLQHRYDDHVQWINKWIDSLNSAGEGWVPWISPVHGGAEAQILTVLRDPGPATKRTQMLSIQNPDATASAQKSALEQAGLTELDIIPWNAHPWWRDNQNKGLSGPEKNRGAQLLSHLLDLLPRVRVVILSGEDAVDTWWKAILLDPELESRHGLYVLRTVHASASGLRGTADQRAAKIAQLYATWKRAAELISIG